MPGNDAQSHKVYLGTDAAKLELIGEKAGSGLMRAEVTGLARNTKYFWRVDEAAAKGRVVHGKVWSFTSPGLAGWWKFDEENGTTAKDSSSNGHDGVLKGNCAWRNNAGKFGGAIELDGETGYVEIGDEKAFDFTDEITVCCWLNTNEVKFDWAGLVTKGDDAWRLSTVSKQRIPHFSVNDWQQVFLNGNKEVTAGDWHHFAGVYDGRQLRLYVDGQPDASIDWDGGIATNDVNVLIGENGAMKGRLWKGLLDDVRVYSYALPKEDITAVFQGGQPKPPEAEKIKIRFDEPMKAAKREK
jgi:hypothetical protein